MKDCHSWNNCYNINEIYNIILAKEVVMTRIKTALDEKIFVGIIVLFWVLIFAFCLSGEINIHYKKESFVIEPHFSDEFEIRYEDIQNIEYNPYLLIGDDVSGYRSLSVKEGTFRHKQLGEYTRYTYISC